MTRIAHVLAIVGLLLAGAQAWGANDSETTAETGIQSHGLIKRLPPETYLRTAAAYSDYSGPIPESDIYGGFADIDGDGRKDLLIVIDNDLTCDDNICDFFVFAPVIKDRQVVTACDWHLVDDRRRPITREAGGRLVAVGGESVVLTRLLQAMPCTLDGKDWPAYFHFEYRYLQHTGSQLIRYVGLTDVRPGNASADGNMIE